MEKIGAENICLLEDAPELQHLEMCAIQHSSSEGARFVHSIQASPVCLSVGPAPTQNANEKKVT